MIMVIDLATGELIRSSGGKSIDAPPERHEEAHCPALVLQEVQAEPARRSMPPELMGLPADELMAKFE